MPQALAQPWWWRWSSRRSHVPVASSGLQQLRSIFQRSCRAHGPLYGEGARELLPSLTYPALAGFLSIGWRMLSWSQNAFSLQNYLNSEKVQRHLYHPIPSSTELTSWKISCRCMGLTCRWKVFCLPMHQQFHSAIRTWFDDLPSWHLCATW